MNMLSNGSWVIEKLHKGPIGLKWESVRNGDEVVRTSTMGPLLNEADFAQYYITRQAVPKQFIRTSKYTILLTKDKDGKIFEEEITEKVETYRERKDFPFYSFRDISGLFKIDLDNEIYRNKTYIKLTLDTVISFADSISYYDYQTFKNNFINENRIKDQKYEIKENFYIANLSKNNLIRIKDEEPFYANFFFFFLSTIFTVALPYEIMLDNISLDGIYQIKKIISTRYNLNSYEYDGMYAHTVPSIKCGNNTYKFTSDDYGYHDANAYVNLPTMEEIENAKKYEEEIKIPIFNDHNVEDSNNLDLPSQEEVDMDNQRKKFY